MIFDNSGVLIVPNRTKGYFKINSEKQVISVQTTDYSGKVILVNSINNQDYKIQSSTGIINFKIKLENGQEVSKKLIIAE